MRLQEGDIKLNDYLNGSDSELENGILSMTGGFDTAVYISLFGSENNNEWMNLFFDENEKIESKAIPFIKSNALTLQNLQKAQKYFENDLNWLKKINACDTIRVSYKQENINTIIFYIEILQNEETIYSTQYNINWIYQSGGTI